MSGVKEKIMRTLQSCETASQFRNARQWAKDTMVKSLMHGDMSIMDVEEVNDYIELLDLDFDPSEDLIQ